MMFFRRGGGEPRVWFEFSIGGKFEFTSSSVCFFSGETEGEFKFSIGKEERGEFEFNSSSVRTCMGGGAGASSSEVQVQFFFWGEVQFEFNSI